jgi:microcystin-dependent protein
MIKKNISQLPLKTAALSPTDEIPVWDTATGTTMKTPVSNLPAGSGGGGGTSTALGSPFRVFNGDASYVINGNNSEITDIRLLGKTGYSVTTNEINLYEFHDDELIYDPINGKVTILNYILPVGHYNIRIYADGVVIPTSYNSILTRIILLEQIAAPFILLSTGENGGVLIWNKPFNLIPPGWAEVTEMRGRLPMGLDATDTDFNTLGNTGGSKDQTLTVAQIPAHDHKLFAPSSQTNLGAPVGSGSAAYNGNYGGNPYAYQIGAGSGTPTIGTSSATGDGDPHSILNPYRIVQFIKFIGI